VGSLVTRPLSVLNLRKYRPITLLQRVVEEGDVVVRDEDMAEIKTIKAEEGETYNKLTHPMRRHRHLKRLFMVAAPG
jgi:hypothetical protein